MTRSTFHSVLRQGVVLLCAILAAACGGGGGGLPLLGGGRTPESSATPVMVHPQLTFTALASGAHYNCGIATDGETYCWGHQDYGELGSTAPMSRCLDDGAWCSAAPLRVESTEHFVAIVSTGGGPGRTCAITAAGRAWCWGHFAGLGDASRENRTRPGPVAGDVEFASVQAGQSITPACGIAKDGATYCWSGAAPTRATWTNRFVAFDLGELHQCGITADGDAYCWGSNWYGQLGIGSSDSGEVAAPALVAGGHKFRAIAASSDSTCALGQDATTWCWGNDVNGGHANLPQRIVEAPPFASIRAGWRHMCGLTQSGEAWCWGYGNPAGSSSMPRRVEMTVPFASLAQRPYCGLDAAGKAWCWGNNDFHQLGY